MAKIVAVKNVKRLALALNNLQKTVQRSDILYPFCSRSIRRQTTVAHAAGAEAARWDLCTAVCLERFPVITPEPTQTERHFQDLLLRLEDEGSKLSDHELRHLEDVRLAELKKQEDYEETEADMMRITAREDEDTWAAEDETFTAASRTTEADKLNDTRSLSRKLDRKLVLLVKQKLGDGGGVWVLPQGRRAEGESMRQSAERVLLDVCGGSLTAAFSGNAPCGYLKYKYPTATREQTGVDGAKVFFYKAQVMKGDVESTTHTEDHLWLTREELEQYLKPKYLKEMNKFLLEL